MSRVSVVASTSDVDAALPGIEAHPHARAVLAPALRPRAAPSHAYLLPRPGGDRQARRSHGRFAAALLADGAAREAERGAWRARTARHASGPDLGDADRGGGNARERHRRAGRRRPRRERRLRRSRRVFVIEAVDTMNDQAANRLLKTLEEPPALRAPGAADRPPRGRDGDDRLALRAGALRSAHRARASREAARGRARRGTGGAGLRAVGARRRGTRRMLASEDGRALRERAEGYVRCCAGGRDRQTRMGRAARCRDPRRDAAPASWRGSDWPLSSSWCRARSAEHWSAKRRRRASGSSVGRAHGRSTVDFRWWSCGCAT